MVMGGVGRLPKYYLGTFGQLVNGASSSMDMVLLGTDGASGNCGSSGLPAVLRQTRVGSIKGIYVLTSKYLPIFSILMMRAHIYFFGYTLQCSAVG